ncbi:MAG: helix-turn-helix domain-containing protein [Acetatifactor sp.]|nr:helix-turn-helix domain-containing protein [Acetatifactor sp.]
MQIQEALSRSEKAKHFHKLDSVLLTVKGMPSKEVASLYNESPTTVSYWIKKVVESGVESLREGKTARWRCYF